MAKLFVIRFRLDGRQFFIDKYLPWYITCLEGAAEFPNLHILYVEIKKGKATYAAFLQMIEQTLFKVKHMPLTYFIFPGVG